MESYSPNSGRKGAFERQLPSYGLIPLIGILLLLGYLTHVIYYAMPTVVTAEEAGYDRFSEERAWTYLRRVVGDGPRVAGSPYHRQKTEELKSMVDEIAAQSDRSVLTDWQIVSGDYYLTYRLPYINSYVNASNIIALLPSGSTDGTSILFNCHYDSVPTSPGASDNAIFCAVLLETLLVLSKSNHTFRHNIIFLFNGAEENSLQASHGFLSHAWSKNVTAVVNLDSTGMNGRSVLFQVTDPRVLSAYRTSVPSPSAQALGEALFSSGAVPSDTDFRVFRDFGLIYGVDIAFTRYGHVYHTRFDSLDLVRPGVLQHSGDMIYNLAKTMADMDEFDVKLEEMNTAVYYDYLNIFMMAYSNMAAHIIDALVAVLGLSSVFYYLWQVGLRRRLIKELLLSVLGMAIAVVCGCLMVVFLTSVMIMTTAQLRYYSNPWMVVPMYWAPFLLVAVSVMHLFDWWRSEKSGLNRSTRTSQMMSASRLMWSVILLALVCLPGTVSMRYAITVPLLLTSVMAVVSMTTRRQWRVKAWQHLCLELLLSLPAIFFTIYLAMSLDALMLPIMGRSVTTKPDYNVAIINVVLAAYTLMPLAGIETLFSRRRLYIPVGIVGILSLVLMFLPLSVYNVDTSSPAPQRYNIFHVDRTNLDRSGAVVSRSSGIWAGHTDALSPSTFLSAIEHSNHTIKTNFTQDCAEWLYCDLPSTTPRSEDFVPFSVWVDFPPPTAFDPTPGVQLISRTCLQQNCTLNFTVTGTPHNSIAIWPRTGVTLISWSLNTEVANVTHKDGRPVYYIWHTHCTYQHPVPPFDLSLTVNVTENINGQTDELLDIAFNAHKTNHDDEMTQEFAALIHSLPEWFNPVPYITARFNYVF